MFHARCQQGDQKMCKLAKEADSMPTRKKTDWKKEREKEGDT